MRSGAFLMMTACAFLISAGGGARLAYLSAQEAETAYRAANGPWRARWPFEAASKDVLLQAAFAQDVLRNGWPLDYALFVAQDDGEGARLHGATHYVLHFSAKDFPPVYGFWSLTLTSPSGSVIQNPLYRASIGDRTPDLVYGVDGSLDIFIQHDPPAVGETNWLPAPPSEFTLTLRAYGPNAAILKREWRPPKPRAASSAA